MNTPADTTEATATLTERVKRQPASLGGYHYHLEPGQRVFVVQTYQPSRTQDIYARCTCSEKGRRISEDFFTVPISSLRIHEGV